MRATIHQLLVGTGALTAVIPTERWYQFGAVEDNPKLPFAILKWLSPVRSNSGSDMHQLQVVIYDKHGSYKRIDDLLGDRYKSGVTVYSTLAGIAGLTGTDGYVAQADYLGHSGDDVDVDYKANKKFSSWQIAGRSL